MEKFQNQKALYSFFLPESNALKKVFRMVRITLFCFFLSLIQVLALDTYSQQTRVSIKLNDQRLEDALKSIEEKSEFFFMYNKDLIDVDKLVSINLTDKTIQNVLDELLKGTDISYSIVNRQIILSNLKTNSVSFAEQKKSVTGKVLDSSGATLPGVSVVVKGTTNGTITDLDGNFKLSNVPENALLVFSFVGMKSQEVSVAGKTDIEIKLVEESIGLDEVVAVGYGSQKKSSLTGAVASISPKELAKLPQSNLGAALQGRSPGVSVTTDGGVAGGAVNILIRGASSLTNVSPLYVIDGAFANNLSGINTADIENMEILKDAAAAAIYGSRAANGVILISTKRGKAGQLQVHLNSSYSLQTPSKYLDFINAQQYDKLMIDVATREGITPAARLTSLFNPAIDEDYQKLWFGNAPMYNVGLDISGGSENSTFYTSANYLNQESILAYSNFKRYDFRLNTSQKRNHFKLDESISVNRTESKPNYAYSGAAYGYDIPLLPARNPDKTLWGANSDGFANGLQSQYYIANPPSTPNPTFTTNNMFATGALSHFNENYTIITGSLKASYEIAKGFMYSLGLNGFYQISTSTYDIPSYTLLDIDGKNPAIQNRSYTQNKGDYFQYTLDNLLSYKKTIGDHDIDVLAGQSWLSESSTSGTIIGGAGNFVSNSITTAQGAVATSGYNYDAGLLSFFGRANYGYKNRYLVSVSARSDASSKFSKSKRVGVFPSLSLGWNIHNESFFKSNFISQAKLRASYGELGANFIPPYSFVSTIRATVPVTLGDQSRSMGTITELANPDLKWETSKTYDIGFDLSFMKNKLSFSADYFYKDNVDLLAGLTPPPSSGRGLDIASSSYFVNSANVRNNGLEFSLTYHKSSGKFTYDVTANLSHVSNKVISLGTNVQPILGFAYSGSFSDSPTITKPGLPIGEFWGYKTAGIYQKDSDVPQSGVEKGKKAGDLIFADTNGDNVVDVNDKVDLGSPFPDFEYGLNFSGNYGNFDMTIYLLGSQGNKIFNSSKYTSYFLTTKAKIADVLNAWTPTNTSSNLPRIATASALGFNALPSSFYVEDGSYLRLKNLQIGYSVPKSAYKKFPLDKIRAYFGVQNLFTITKYSGYDPEVAVIPRETLNAAATGGRSKDVNILFNRGVDSRAYPRDRTFTIGLQLTF